ncbi:MAG: BamA/TamA family outer membrane protein [Verrucomicrobiota bacterium]
MNRKSSCRGFIFFLGAIFLAIGLVAPMGFAAANAEKPPEPRPAELSVSGYGFFGNRELKHNLRLLIPGEKVPEFLDANFIEDAGLLLFSTVQRDGYLQPSISVEVTLADGHMSSYELDPELDRLLPRPIQARRVAFRVKPGVLYHFNRITWEGLTALPEKEAAHFFIETDALLPLKKTRIFTMARLDRGLSSLKEFLERKGFEQAEVTAHQLERDDRTGDVNVIIRVREGPKTIVRFVRTKVFRDGAVEPTGVSQRFPEVPYSKLWLQDLIQELKKTEFQLGYPDAEVEVTGLKRESMDGVVLLDLEARVKSGGRITLREVRFEGLDHTRESFLQRRVDLDEGQPLNRLQAEQGRIRLVRLGIFNSVELDYEKVDEETRDILYRVREGKKIDVSLLVGFGSYELLRGGVELEQHNVFGLAHHARLRAVQSFKSSSANYTYSMPGLFGEEFDLFLNGFGLIREEVSFTREEFGGGIGARRYFPEILTDISGRYNYQVLSATREEVDPRVGLPSANVGSFIFDFKHDQRDNPLYPRRGYKVFSKIEVASEYLAGDVNFQRFELAGSIHQSLGAGRWLHAGLGHGFILTAGTPAEDLPFNKRFFLGGDSSLRGFQQGEASPVNERGGLVGSETYLEGSIEIEQALTSNWSFVGFFDGLGFARDLSDYPLSESLFSAGAGIRWKTLIGPIRLEYGHNLNPRRGDPSGTVHLSVGFPF